MQKNCKFASRKQTHPLITNGQLENKQGIEQHLGLRQKLSQQQVRFVRMLEMSGAEAAQDVRRELDENEALEVADQTTVSTHPESSETAHDAGWLPVVAPGSGRTVRGEFIQPQAADESLYEALNRQLDTLDLPAEIDRTARYIIGNIDANGYLRRPPQSMTTDMLLNEDFEPTPQEMTQALEAVRSLDPAGVGAESLQQSMELQLRRMNPTQELNDALRIVERHFDRLAARRFSQLLSDTDNDPERLEQALALLRRLNPKPGAAFGSDREVATYVEPDFVIDVDNGNVQVTLTGSVPELMLSQSFTQAVADMNRRRSGQRDQYVVQRYNDAREYLRILERRQQTLMDVMTAIVDLQQPYFLSRGDDSLLHPMGLKEVAARTGLDVSVVSRATKNKYAQMPWATVPMRFFFSEGFATSGDGETVSGRSVEQAIRQAIEKENKQHPLSDEAICTLLRESGFDVSRRTVSKYRDRLGIPVARLRSEGR